jgi:hypothetical protein
MSKVLILGANGQLALSPTLEVRRSLGVSQA